MYINYDVIFTPTMTSQRLPNRLVHKSDFYPEGPCIKKEGTRGWKYYLTKTRKAGENCEDTCWKDPDCMLATFDNSKIGSRNNCFLYGVEMLRTTNRLIEDKKFTSYECKTGKLSK